MGPTKTGDAENLGWKERIWWISTTWSVQLSEISKRPYHFQGDVDDDDDAGDGNGDDDGDGNGGGDDDNEQGQLSGAEIS